MKATTNQFLKDKLTQYQNGVLSPEETEIIDKWFNTNLPAKEMEADLKSINDQQLYLELLKPLKEAISQQKPKVYKMPGLWLKVACVILLITAVSIFTIDSLKTNLPSTSTSYQTYVTQKGEVKMITLQDGTTIWMNASTAIRVASNFNTLKFRKVFLDEGEAFFKVKRDTLRPFSIATKSLVTTVLGTSFNIRAYPESNVYQVAVATGKVKVEQLVNNQIKILNDGLIKDQVLTQQLLANTTVIKNRDASLISNWKTNRSININNLTLSQIGEELSRQYNIEVKVTPGSGSDKTYSIHLQHQDLQIVLQQLAVATGINYQLTKSKLIINPAPQ